MMFTWSEDDLNPEQSNAVLYPDSLFLVACPGSGKTRTLTYKIAYELSRLESSRQCVVAITYTHRAAEEIHDRIEAMGVDTGQLWIGTIHSFCLEWIIKPYGIYEPRLAYGYHIIDLHKREVLLKSLCEPYKSSRVTFWDCDYYFTQDECVLGCPDHSKHAIIHQVLSKYWDILFENKQIDFELILYFSCKLLGEHQQISSNLSKLFSLLLVDEFQDTKEIQYLIISSILKAGGSETKLFMVGDPNQAIYGSLGGYAIELEQLRGLSCIPIKKYELSSNYRSSDRIIQYFGNFNVCNTSIKAEGKEKNYPSLVSFADAINSEDLVDEIERLIRYNVETLGISPDQVCVLAPQWFYLATMTRMLVSRMPEYQFDGPGMIPLARDIDNFWYKLARIALARPSPATFIRRLRWAGVLLKDLGEAGISIPKISPRLFLRECNTIIIDEQDGLVFLRKFFETIFSKLDISYEGFTQLEEQHEAFFSSSEARIARITNDGVEGAGSTDFFRRVFRNRSGVTVSTIHGVKGAEYDVVIAYALLHGMVPHFNDVDGDTSARRLLYVIGSRARKNLHLFSEVDRSRGSWNVYEPTTQLASCVFDYDDIGSLV